MDNSLEAVLDMRLDNLWNSLLIIFNVRKFSSLLLE
jgi:hypothetical protein